MGSSTDGISLSDRKLETEASIKDTASITNDAKHKRDTYDRATY